MSCIDSDLEEGEIPDDSPSSPHVTVKKDRDLPRRYVLRENKSTHKHKRDCKYAIRYHAKKLTKLKKTPSRVSSKKHRKSCPHDKSKKPNIKYDSPVSDHLIKNGHSFSKYSLISEIKCSVKKKTQNLIPNRSNPQISLSETKNKTANDNLRTTETSESNKNNETELRSTNDSVSDSRQHDEYHIEISEKLPLLIELDSSNSIKDTVVNCSPKADSDESEDEEELRRIALATCAKRKLILEPQENMNQIVNSNCNVSVPEPSEVNIQIIPREISNLASDNYEVVDMEVDEDTENSVEILDDESLFVIDTKPSSKLDGNIENSAPEVQNKGNSSDDDFEADILRAELIGSMFRKRALEEQLEDIKPIANTFSKQTVIEDKISVAYQKPNVNLRQNSLQPAKRILRKNGMNKSVKLKCSSSKLAHNNQVNRSPKRLIISLNGESSSEESDDVEEVNTAPENPVASIEALISDCRQKSDSSEKTNEVIKHVPKALSCLSKAQQEEYNSLLKILAEKKKLPASQQTLQHNNGSVHSALDDLKLLEEKMSKFKETLKKKKLMMTNISKDVDEKQQMYMKSKLSAQLLKEQYVAAEKVRRIKLDEWSKSCKNFEVVKKSVSSLESKIIQLQNLCSKLGSSVQGHGYNLPSLPINNDQL